MVVRRWAWVVLALVLLTPCRGAVQEIMTEETRECSRMRSRLARAAIERDMPSGYRLPGECAFMPERDRYRLDEAAKRLPSMSNTRWTCTLCKKAFRSEPFLDLHLGNRHKSNATVRRRQRDVTAYHETVLGARRLPRRLLRHCSVYAAGFDARICDGSRDSRAPPGQRRRLPRRRRSQGAQGLLSGTRGSVVVIGMVSFDVVM